MPDGDPTEDDVPGPCVRHPWCDSCTCPPEEGCTGIPEGLVLGSTIEILGCPTRDCTWPKCADKLGVDTSQPKL